jgi:AraC family transcriptional regulator
MTYSITTREIAPQAVLLARRRVKPSEIAQAIAGALGEVFLHAQKTGAVLGGPPFNRYVEWGPGIMTIEPGMPVSSSAGEIPSGAGVKADTLPGGLVATMMHTGPYDKLAESHAAIQQWIDAEGLLAAGAPWEFYITDPADFPDPADWKTELFWPLAAKS